MSRDPFPGFSRLPKTLNLYVYCANNPINYIDPFGLVYCQIEWYEGGRYDIGRPRIEKKRRGYWEARAKHAAYWLWLASLLTPVSEEQASRRFAYYIDYTAYQLQGIYLRYYEVCYDDCGNQISKKFLFQTRSGKTEESIIDYWTETHYVGG